MSEFDWGGLYAHLIASTGWEWGQIDNLDLSKVEVLVKYYNEHPPLHLMVASFLDIKPSPETPKVVDNSEFLRMLTGGVLRG